MSVTAIRSVLRRYSAACLEVARRKRAGEVAHYPRRKRALVPLRWHRGTFEVVGRRVRVSLAVGAPPCWLRLWRPFPIQLARFAV